MPVNEHRAAIAAAVRAEMARRQITAQQLAPAVGLGRGVLGSRLRAATDFTGTELIAIAAYLDVPVGTFFVESAA